MRLILLPVLFLGCLTAGGCGSGGGDDTVEDNRVCITNINNNPQVNVQAAAAEAEELGLEVIGEATDVPLVEDNFGLDVDVAGDQLAIRQVAICGTNAQVEAVIQSDERPALSNFLATGQERLPSDSEELL